MKRRQSRLLAKRLRRLERRQDQVTREVLNAVAHILEEYLPEYEVDITPWVLPKRGKLRKTRHKRHHGSDSFTRKVDGDLGTSSSGEKWPE